MEKILIIQTAFIGDVILTTPIAEKLHRFFPTAQIDFLVRKGNEGLLADHPYLHNVIVWNKESRKYNDLVRLSRHIRKNRYDMVINLQRFAASGFLTANSGASVRIGFDKNPFAFSFTNKVPHIVENGMHEVERNLKLIESFTDDSYQAPRLYPRPADYELVDQYQLKPYVCIAPTSVWFTKQYPLEHWAELIRKISAKFEIYLLGGPKDQPACAKLLEMVKDRPVTNLCGKLGFLASAALMQDAKMNYVNDSAPMHMASALNAPTTAVFCSTVPAFGFGPLSDEARIVETQEVLTCRPCGLHGRKACPKGHFKCAHTIETSDLVWPFLASD